MTTTSRLQAAPVTHRLKPRPAIRNWVTSYALLSPFLILFLIFVVWPILQSGYWSLTKYTLIKPPEFIGFENYINLFKDRRLIKAMLNISGYVAGLVILNTALGLTLALIFRGQGLVNQIIRTAFFLPAVSGSVATSVVWRWIFTGEDYGLANTIRHWLGLPSMSFLSTTNLTIPILIIVSVWGSVGLTMIFFLAGLQGISQEYYEAAALDGASPLQRLLHITIPLLRPTFLYVIITGLITAFQLFDSSYVLYRSVEGVGGPLDSALTPVLYLYDRAFNRFQMGYASSIAWLLFGIIVILTLINLRIGRVNAAD